MVSNSAAAELHTQKLGLLCNSSPNTNFFSIIVLLSPPIRLSACPHTGRLADPLAGGYPPKVRPEVKGEIVQRSEKTEKPLHHLPPTSGKPEREKKRLLKHNKPHLDLSFWIGIFYFITFLCLLSRPIIILMREVKGFVIELFSEFASIDPEKEIKLWLEDKEKGVNVIVFRGEKTFWQYHPDNRFFLLLPEPENLKQFLYFFNAFLSSSHNRAILYYTDILGQEVEKEVDFEKLRKSFDLLKEAYCEKYGINFVEEERGEEEEEIEIEFRKPDGTVIKEKIRLP